MLDWRFLGRGGGIFDRFPATPLRNLCPRLKPACLLSRHCCCTSCRTLRSTRKILPTSSILNPKYSSTLHLSSLVKISDMAPQTQAIGSLVSHVEGLFTRKSHTLTFDLPRTLPCQRKASLAYNCIHTYRSPVSAPLNFVEGFDRHRVVDSIGWLCSVLTKATRSLAHT